LKDNKGAIVIPAGTVQQEDDVALESMNYLVAGVVGQS
jgi:simple sugar transport system substrate-binding protein